MMKRWSLVIVLIGCLTGCFEKPTHETLLQHPKKLEKELSKCRDSREYTSYCDMVKQTAEQFSALSYLRAEDPEGFGKQILEAQIELKKSQIAARDAKTSETMRHQAEKESERLQEKVNTLLAVVAGTSSPG